jgi:hypothetical protein
MTAEPEIAARDRVRLGGAAYLVEALQEAAGFRGAWTCAHCGQTGRSAAKYTEMAAAMAWAKVGASVHHLAVHSDDEE